MKIIVASLLFSSLALAAGDVKPTQIAAPSLVIVGMPFDFSVVVQNGGDKDEGPFSVGIYLNTDKTVSLFGKKLGQLDGVRVAAGQSTTLKISITVPAGVATGKYTLGAIVDPLNVLHEPLRTDKTLGTPVNVQVPLPDFVARLVDAPEQGNAGEALLVHRVIENIGNLPGAANYGIYLSSNSTLSKNDLLIGSGTATIAAGAGDDAVDTVTLPQDLAPGTYNVGLQINVDGSVNELVSTNNTVLGGKVTVGAATLSLQTAAVPEAIVGIPYIYSLSATGGESTYVWSKKGDLPAGMSLSEDGVLSGTPTVAAATTPMFRVTSGTHTASRVLVVNAVAATVPLAVYTASVPAAPLGAVYSVQLVVVGGSAPFGWKVSAGDLPPGITLATTGLLQGVASAMGAYGFTVRVVDATGVAATKDLVLPSVEAGGLSIQTPILEDAVVGTAYAATLRAVGGAAPYSWNVAAGQLPPGLSLKATSVGGEQVAGRPTQAGLFAVQIAAQDSNGAVDSNTYLLRVVPASLAITTTVLPAAAPGVAYDAQLASASATAKWSILNGVLPNGLKLNGDFGTISGMVDPAARGGLYGLLVRAEDAAGGIGYAGLTIDVVLPTVTPVAAKKQGCASAGGAGLLALMAVLFLRRRRAVVAAAVLLVGAAGAQAGSLGYGEAIAPKPFAALTLGNNDALSFVGTEDNGVVTVNLPFGFQYYSASFSQLNVGVNGAASFTATTIPATPAKGSLPAASLTANLLAPWYDDLYMCPGGTKFESSANGKPSIIAMQTLGVSPDRVVVIEWRNMQHNAFFSSCEREDAAFNFQLRLHETSNVVEFDYGPAAPATSTFWATASSAIIGLQNDDGTRGGFVPCQSARCVFADFQPDTSVTFTPGVDWAIASITAPSSLRRGEILNVSTHLSNTGTADAPATVLHYRALPLSGTAVTLGDVAIPALAIGSSFDASFAGPWPSSLGVGDYTIVAAFDGAAVDIDVNPADDVMAASNRLLVEAAAGTYTCAAVTPDSATVPVDGAVGVTFTVSASQDADVPWALILSPLSTVTAADLVLQTGTVHVAAGGTETVSAQGKLKGVRPGSYTVGCLVNAPLGGATPLPQANPFQSSAVAASPLNVIGAGALAVATSTLPAANVGAPWDVQLVATGGDGVYVWTATGNLPEGLKLSTSGALGGALVAPGDVSLGVQVASANATAKATLTLHVTTATLPLAIASQTLPAVAWGAAYNVQLVALGGKPPYAWSLASGTLPQGLALGADGVLQGRPLGAGDSAFTVAVMDAASAKTSAALKLTVVPNTRPVINPLTLSDALLGHAYNAQLGAVGGTAPYTFQLLLKSRLPLAPADGPAINSQDPPSGLSISPAGAITGTPTSAGLYALVLKVTDSTGATGLTDVDTVTLRVRFENGIRINTFQLPDALIGQSYSASLHAIGGDGQLTWTLLGLAGGGLPEGLQLADNGTLAGKATAIGEKNFTVRVQDQRGRVDIQAMALTVKTPVAPVKAAAGGCASTSEAGWLAVVAALVLIARRRARRAAALFAAMMVAAGCAKTQDRCAVVTCATGESCDSDSGLCLCGGPGGRQCVPGTACDLSTLDCALTDRCANQSCGGSMTCDAADGVCKCGGAGGLVCGQGESCNPTSRACGSAIGACTVVTCPGVLTCDLTDGQCKCAGVACSAGQRCDGKTCVADLCAGSSCAGGETCDPADGVCKCGGAGGPICFDGRACDAANRRCITNDQCAGVTCAGGESCDPTDGLCHCGGPAGPTCGKDQTCDADRRVCLEGDRCVHVTCAVGTCNAEDGLCHCGDANATICSAAEVCIAGVGSGAAPRCATVCDPAHSTCATGLSCQYGGSAVPICGTPGNVVQDAKCAAPSDCADGLGCIATGGTPATICTTYCHLPEVTCADARKCVQVPGTALSACQVGK